MADMQDGEFARHVHCPISHHQLSCIICTWLAMALVMVCPMIRAKVIAAMIEAERVISAFPDLASNALARCIRRKIPKGFPTRQFRQR